MGRSGLFMLIVIVLLAIGAFFYFSQDTTVTDIPAPPAAQPSAATEVPAVGDTAPAEEGAPSDLEAFPDLIPDNE